MCRKGPQQSWITSMLPKCVNIIVLFPDDYTENVFCWTKKRYHRFDRVNKNASLTP